MAGCDGRMKSSKLFDRFCKSITKRYGNFHRTNTNAKYNFNIGGIPGDLSGGQCNDSTPSPLLLLKLKDIWTLRILMNFHHSQYFGMKAKGSHCFTSPFFIWEKISTLTDTCVLIPKCCEGIRWITWYRWGLKWKKIKP